MKSTNAAAEASLAEAEKTLEEVAQTEQAALEGAVKEPTQSIEDALADLLGVD